jgi:DNA-binding Xre family transcriptional regulator
MYEEILALLQLYEISDMRNIKNNLYDIFKYKKLTRGSFVIIGITINTEISYLNACHPNNIPFLTLLKICNYLNVSMDEVIKPNNRKPDPNRSKKGSLIWTRKKQKEFLLSIEENGIEETMKKYNLGMESIAKYMTQFGGKLK